MKTTREECLANWFATFEDLRLSNVTLAEWLGHWQGRDRANWA